MLTLHPLYRGLPAKNGSVMLSLLVSSHRLSRRHPRSLVLGKWPCAGFPLCLEALFFLYQVSTLHEYKVNMHLIAGHVRIEQILPHELAVYFEICCPSFITFHLLDILVNFVGPRKDKLTEVDCRIVFYVKIQLLSSNFYE